MSDVHQQALGFESVLQDLARKLRDDDSITITLSQGSIKAILHSGVQSYAPENGHTLLERLTECVSASNLKANLASGVG